MTTLAVPVVPVLIPNDTLCVRPEYLFLAYGKDRFCAKPIAGSCCCRALIERLETKTGALDIFIKTDSLEEYIFPNVGWMPTSRFALFYRVRSKSLKAGALSEKKLFLPCEEGVLIVISK